MSFKILYITATSSEADALRRLTGVDPGNGVFRLGQLEIVLMIAGVGSASTSWNMNRWFSGNGKPDLVINAGIAGSYKADISIGDVVTPLCDCFADAGIESGENFLTLFETGFADRNEFPYRDGHIYTDNRFFERLKGIIRPVRAITVNTSTGTEATKNKLQKKFNPDIETMEGATFFYICAREKVPFLALRAVSNMVEPRNRDHWNIDLALKNLSEKLNEFFITL